MGGAREVNGSEGRGVLTEAWEQQNVWSQAADRVKASIVRARLLALLLGVSFAVLGAASAQLMAVSAVWGKSLAFAAAVAAASASLVAQRATPQRIRDWTRLRSLSEGMKAQLYARLAGGGAYRTGDPDALLAERIDGLRADGADLARHCAHLVPVSRPLPAVHDLASYMDLRVRGQIAGYYRPNAVLMGRRLAAVRRAELTLSAAAAVLAAAGGAFELAATGVWLGVAATVTMAVTAHAAAAKYDYQELEFSRTAEELDRVYRHWRRQPPAGPADEDRIIERCEDVISVQNEAWMVKWQGQ
ncbi:DUF4231 domain-containing protein [Streptomyces sp. NPDC001339]|uniref:DUF4231 domain-containing protein n=1 Tax=Streptomyces sp. NPDC001339 TaxID=3364563 RepID=UPI0036A137DE